MPRKEPFAPPDDQRPLTVILRASDGRLAGDLIGETWWGWLHVMTLWIEEPAQRLGYGSALLKQADREAFQPGFRAAYLSTLSYEARPFYERHDYEVCGEVPDFPPGHRRCYLMKRLDPSA